VDDLLSEKEQIEQIRAWWKEYGAYVIGGLVLGIGAIIGYNQWQQSQHEAQLAASSAYEALLVHVDAGELDEAEVAANEIVTNYGGTAYAAQSGLALARLYMDKNRDQDAADALLAVVNGKSGEELKNVARLRLARIYIYQDKAEAAVDLLKDQDVEAFAAAFGEVLGDAYTALGRTAEAQQAYQSALLSPSSQGAIDQQLVQWKSLDLPPVDAAAPDDSTEPATGNAVESEDPASEEGE